jgi:hypothetical protein
MKEEINAQVMWKEALKSGYWSLANRLHGCDKIKLD